MDPPQTSSMMAKGNQSKGRVLLEDITLDGDRPQTKYPIPLINDIDEETLDESFIYRTKNIYEKWARSKHPEREIVECAGCSCESECKPGSCQCIDNSTIRLYKHRITFLGREKSIEFFSDILYECSEETCRGCKGKCANRLTPNQFDLKVELYKTEKAGFAVRSKQYIRNGTYFDEFVGEYLDYSDQEVRQEDYAYNIAEGVNGEGYYIDPFYYGNITRFLNHSCEPNLMPFRFHSSKRGVQYISIGFFALQDIEPEEDLTIDYGVDWWKKNMMRFFCQCGTRMCIHPPPGKPGFSDFKNQDERKRYLCDKVIDKARRLEKWQKENKAYDNDLSRTFVEITAKSKKEKNEAKKKPNNTKSKKNR